MELSCEEQTPLLIGDTNCEKDYIISNNSLDHNILSDDRVLTHLLNIETQYVPNGVLNSLNYTQSEIEPYMRKIVANWILEVCEELKCEEVIFPLAMNYLDRFVKCTSIRKSQLQLVGVVCLLIATKLRQCNSLDPHLLSYFTDYSVTVQEIIGWELLVLTRLKWDVSAVVATDYLDHLLVRLFNQNNQCEASLKNINSIIRKHSSTFVALCTTEVQFSCCTPSLIASASIATAVHGIQLKHKPWKSFEKFLSLLENLTNIESSRIQKCVDQIEALISSTAMVHNLVNSSLVNTSPVSVDDSAKCINNIQYAKYVNEISIFSNIKLSDNILTFSTPTDIQDIYF